MHTATDQTADRRDSGRDAHCVIQAAGSVETKVEDFSLCVIGQVRGRGEKRVNRLTDFLVVARAIAEPHAMVKSGDVGGRTRGNAVGGGENLGGEWRVRIGFRKNSKQPGKRIAMGAPNFQGVLGGGAVLQLEGEDPVGQIIL